VRGSLLATWDETREALAYIADWGFIENKVKDARRKIFPQDITIQQLPDTLIAPDEVVRVRSRLVLNDPARPITQPLIAAALQHYDQIDWKAPGHDALHHAIKQAIGPPAPLQRLQEVRAEAAQTIQEKIADHVEILHKARAPKRRDVLDTEIERLHAVKVLMPLRAAHLAELMHIDMGNAYQLISRYTGLMSEFFNLSEDDAPHHDL